MEDTGDAEATSRFVFYRWSVNFEWRFFFMKSWSNKAFFFSSNSISFASLTRTNFLYIRAGNDLEEALEGQERRKKREEGKKTRGDENNNIVIATMQVLVEKRR